MLKTFVSVEQKNCKFGERVKMEKKDMHHEVEVYCSLGNGSEPEMRMEKTKLLDGFPISKRVLINCKQNQN